MTLNENKLYSISSCVFLYLGFDTQREWLPVPPDSSPFKHNPLYPAVYTSSLHAHEAHQRMDASVIKPSLDDLLRRRAPHFQFGFFEKLFAKRGIPRSLSRSRRTVLFREMRSNYEPDFSALEPIVLERVSTYFALKLRKYFFNNEVRDSWQSRADEFGPCCLLWYHLLHKKGYRSMAGEPAFVLAAVKLIDFEAFFSKSILQVILFQLLCELYRRDESLLVVPDYIFSMTCVPDFAKRLDSDSELIQSLPPLAAERDRKQEDLERCRGTSLETRYEQELAQLNERFRPYRHWIRNAEILRTLTHSRLDLAAKAVRELASLNNDKE